ncbi:hemolysin family protein [uncultured Pseudokineococcus sp.]|uniref:hemolysin family protein n=1 Tax=uncultured Pseudokineococcus sp. TaxID=1642928 RepID=UPI002636AE6B|nr:hemolysin family protein [uncultured Pseudokineococcus sp.]
MSLGWEILLVLVFVLVGGVFAMSELALVSLRDGQVRAMVGERLRGAAAVERLRASTNRFLSAVQIGVTAAGFFASAYGGATIAGRLTPVLEGWGVPSGLAGTVSLVVITALVSYVSLVLGELVPKRIALQKPDTVSRLVAPMLDRIAKLATPVIWLLDKSTNLVVRLLGMDPGEERDEVSEEELREMVSTHEDLDDDERRLIDDVFAAADRRVAEVMIPRTEVEFLDGGLTLEEAAGEIEHQAHSRYPITGEGVDDIIGFVHVRDVLTALRHQDPASRLTTVMRPVSLVTGTQAVLPALSEMRRTRRHIAVVVDEYGGTDGIVTLEDLVEELVGDIQDEHDRAEADAGAAVRGQVEVSGLLHRDEVADETGVQLPEGSFETLGGFVMAELGRVPAEGDSVEALGHRFTVLRLDGRRADRVCVERLGGDDEEGDGAEDGEAGSSGAGREPHGRAGSGEVGTGVTAGASGGADGAGGASGGPGRD